MASDVQAIKNYIASNQAVIGSKAPALSALDDELMSTTLSASLVANAEASQPWSTIGFDQWIGAGKWWLLRAQLVLRTIGEREQSIAPAAYADLIKADWILADVIPCHPQFPFISAGKSSELRSLSAEVKNEFSRITTLAIVVPALDELCGQDLRLWESIPVKAPILRPYTVSQNLDAWRVDGGEHVLFRRFAFRELDAVTTSPCILLLLVHESAKAARLIAQDQYGDIVKAISFPELSVWEEDHRVRSKRLEDPKSVIFGEEKFVLSHVHEAQILCTMIEATNFYVLGRQVDHFSLEDLKAYALLTAVKNQQEQAVEQIRQKSPQTNTIVKSDQKESLPRLAVSMASQWLEGRLFQTDKDDIDYRDCWNRRTSLLTWAVICNYTSLTEYLLSENPVIEYSHDLLHILATYGNESLVRWFLSSSRANDGNLHESLAIAMQYCDENMVALLVDMGADFSNPPYFSLKIIHQFQKTLLPELVVHAILAFAYATKAESECHLQEAADQGHEGAIVLVSYAQTMKRLDTCDYSSRLTHNSGNFRRVIAALAKVGDIIPAFALTLLNTERQRTKVRLNTGMLPGAAIVLLYLDSYHAYIADVSRSLQQSYKKAIKIAIKIDERVVESSFTVVHQEESLVFNVRALFTTSNTWLSRATPWMSLETDSSKKVVHFEPHEYKSVVLPIHIRQDSRFEVARWESNRKRTSYRATAAHCISIPTQHSLTYQRRSPRTPSIPQGRQNHNLPYDSNLQMDPRIYPHRLSSRIYL